MDQKKNTNIKSPKITPKKSAKGSPKTSTQKATKETAKASEIVEKEKRKIFRNRIYAAILSFLLFIISLYFIYVAFGEDTSKLTARDIQWRFTTIIRLMIALFGYIGAVLYSKRLLVISMALIAADLILSFLIYCFSFKDLDEEYERYLVYLANIDREKDSKDSDCHFIKVFRRRVVENLILVSFYIFYCNSIIYLFRQKTDETEPSDAKVKPIHSKWILIFLSFIHFLFSIFLFWSKTFRNDQNEDIVYKNDFKYVFLWTLLAFLSMIIAFLTPFALLHVNFKNKFMINFFISTVMTSTFFGSAKFLLIVLNEVFSENPKKDYFCNTRITSVDSFGSIFVLLIINKIMITLLLSLASEIKANIKSLTNAEI